MSRDIAILYAIVCVLTALALLDKHPEMYRHFRRLWCMETAILATVIFLAIAIPLTFFLHAFYYGAP